MTISIEHMEVTQNKYFDDKQKGLSGVELEIYLYSSNPNDTGTLEIQWGHHGTEKLDIAYWGLSLGDNEIGNSLPPGTHRICARMV